MRILLFVPSCVACCWLLLLSCCYLIEASHRLRTAPSFRQRLRRALRAVAVPQICRLERGAVRAENRTPAGWGELLLILISLLAWLLHSLLTVVEQRKIIQLIDSNLVTLHLIALVITRRVISYKRNC